MSLFCPRCACEFQSTVKTCPEDGCKLTKRVPKRSETHEDIYAAHDAIEADFLTGSLRENGVDAIQSNDNISQFATAGNQRSLVSVAHHQVKKAVDIIKTARQNKLISENGMFV